MSATPYDVNTEKELVFSFVSEGPKGRIVKLVKYQEILPNLYNLGFGDQIPGTLEVDDKVVSNNSDLDKVMASVMLTIGLFFRRKPDSAITFKGSNLIRTKLYQRIIQNYSEPYRDLYYFYGGNDSVGLEPFNPKTEYLYFIISMFPII